ncbi:MAG: hypothetical protein ISS57_02580 [Anaerolineales bacterium]|nr:hypothetical protein [Chloroflexota bacterium]MBL7161464.1 hypothetical protein [Anaerolineales bacterium]
MKTAPLREQLLQQIDHLPDDIVQQIADFAQFLMVRRKIAPLYDDWSDQQWQDMALEQLFRENDEVTYTLKDAQEVYRP